ncbi:Phosphoinositide phospholipase C, Ca2+-dependent [Catalinimonas alkaloidigena]|uniref:Phosphoinositide phospholipase C, Ca2+-dependent n=1 Tax=Catalinimonas alkaloidigena TaxID=1075417 RepID=A0A1G9TFC9_9BACT|nr:phosphatidylinositol-specific phospholipase C1-like protein [Catalinimonas alkaloidigena]SDM46451.1 Phosphoinositide phospholipase C, Ca2+-dependent [Catalinimonas alkaloidigena]
MTLQSASLFLLGLLLPILGRAQDDQRPINQLQVIGSHNSYKQAIEPALFKVLEGYDREKMQGLAYEHIPIPEQLDRGLRNLEIDVYADTQGGKYAHPKGLTMAPPDKPYDPEGLMQQPGFKVFHVPDIDFRSSCLTLDLCLSQLKRWSDAHPNHTPVFITLEAKGGGTSTGNPWGLTVPEAFTEAMFDELDRVLRQGLGEEKLMTPDDVRGRHKTLEQAVLKDGWPTLQSARGKFLFVLDDTGEKRAMYIKNHPSLKGRVLFVNAEPGTPEAAILIRNNPQDATLPDLVRRGYIIRTRADADTRQARTNDYSHFRAAADSGAQIITTDYYQESSFFDSPYRVAFEGGVYVRPNPLFPQ